MSRTPTPDVDVNFGNWRDPTDASGGASLRDDPPNEELYLTRQDVDDALDREARLILPYVTITLGEVHNLLEASVDVPQRFETVCDILNVPENVKQMMRCSKMAKPGSKRSSGSGDNTEAKKQRVEPGASSPALGPEPQDFNKVIADMFPDVDLTFLARECQHLQTSDDLSRFINTIMLTGLYTTKGTVVDVPDDEDTLSVIADYPYRSSASYDTDESDSASLDSVHISPVPVPQHYVPCVTLDNSPETVPHSAQPSPMSVDSNSNLSSPARATPSCSTEFEGAEGNVQAGAATVQPTAGNEVQPAVSGEVQPSDTGSEQGESHETEAEWIEAQAACLEKIFPKSDPIHIRSQLSQMNMSLDTVNAFVLSKLEHNDMPTRDEYQKRVEMERLQNLYTNNFSIEEFLVAIPDPWKYFEGSSRKCSKYRGHSVFYLKGEFRNHSVKMIEKTLLECNDNLFATYKILVNSASKTRNTRRSQWECDYNRPTSIDIQFLQEVAFIKHEAKIKAYITAKETKRKLQLEEARVSGLLVECMCCYDSEVLAQDVVYCPSDHTFCRDCVVRCVEVEMGNGRSTIQCMSTCTATFPLSTLQAALRPEVFSKLLHAAQLEEIQAAGIEDLAQCPFCNYATILPSTERVLKCLNPECLKESCLLCKETSHIPLRCEEVEKSEEVRLRILIENKMTEALVRECYKCKKKFVKEEGCNKMTCTCGAQMCYVCRQPVHDYNHFNGQGGTDYQKCPLYSTNDELHVDSVMRVAEAAKQEALSSNPSVVLKHDPTLVAPPRTYDAPLPGAGPNRANAPVNPILNVVQAGHAFVAYQGVVGRQVFPPGFHHVGRRHHEGQGPDQGRRRRHRERRVVLLPE